MAKPFAAPDGNGVCHDPPQPGCSGTARDDTIRFTFTVPDGWASNDSGASIFKPARASWRPMEMTLLFDRGGWLYSDPASRSRPRNCLTSRSDRRVDDVRRRACRPSSPRRDDSHEHLARSDTAGNTSTSSSRRTSPATFGYYPWEPAMPAQGPSHRRHLWILDVDGIRVVVRTDGLRRNARPQTWPSSRRSWTPSRSNPDPGHARPLDWPPQAGRPVARCLRRRGSVPPERHNQHRAPDGRCGPTSASSEFMV